nr:PREDICTED: uncharacterized protein LOC109035270 isoform X1 [Bemisia tabaci]
MDSTAATTSDPAPSNPTHFRSLFFDRKQGADEEFDQFLTAARTLVEKCKFGNLTQQLLRDKVVSGISDSQLKRIFIADPSISLETITLMCRARTLSEEQLLKLLSLKREEGILRCCQHVNQVENPTARTEVLDSTQRGWNLPQLFSQPNMENGVGTNGSAEETASPSKRMKLMEEPEISSHAASAESSNATFRFSVENISELREWWRSPELIVSNISWSILVKPITWKDNPSRKSLACAFQCVQRPTGFSWSCFVILELKILSQKNGVKPISGRIQLKFDNTKMRKKSHRKIFIPWRDLFNYEKVYVVDDSITLEGTLSVAMEV